MLATIAHTSLAIQCSSKEPPTERATQRSHLSPHDSMCHVKHSFSFHEIVRLGGLVPSDGQFGRDPRLSDYFRFADHLGVNHRMENEAPLLVTNPDASQSIGSRFRQAYPRRSRYTIDVLAPRE
jgi:hypothetical protein